jgi:DNA-binding transcriptional MocR family regulator
MTIAIPRKAERKQPIYREIADAIGREVQSGRAGPGTRLPTQRALARQLGVTLTTVTRGYEEAERRGLVAGEVGRGTYIRALRSPDELRSHHAQEGINLSTNSLMPLAHAADLADRLAKANSRTAALSVFDYHPAAGLRRNRMAGATWIARTGLDVSADRVIVTAGGQHGIFITLRHLTKPGDEVLVEEFTYANLRKLASDFQLRLRALPMDAHGLLPQALDAACRSGHGKLLYTIPTLQNPTASVMPEARRREIAAVVRKHGLLVIEDDVYAYLLPDVTPLTKYLPEDQAVYITSTSKSLAPGIRIGYLAAPSKLIEPLAAGIARTMIYAPPAMAEFATMLITDGTAVRIVDWKRKETAERQEIVGRVLSGLRFQTHPYSPHIWLHLPEPWQAPVFVSQARQRGVRLHGAGEFAADPETPLQAVRLCLGPPESHAILEEGLTRVARIFQRTREPNELVV